MLPFLNLSPNFEARITPSLGNVIKSNTQIQVVFNRSIDITNFSAELGSQLTSVWSQTSIPNDTVVLTGNFPLGNQSFLLNAMDTSNPNATVQSAALFFLGGSPTIRNNRVLAGNVNTATTYSIAILVGSSSSLITENPMISGASGIDSFGIFIDNSATPTISNNTIHGGSASGSAHAIYNDPSANAPNIFGNSLYGGIGSISYGLNNSTPSNPILTNNTIDGGIGNTSRAIYQGAIGANVGTYIGNRLFTSGGTNRFCFFEAGLVSPISFNNNQLTNCPTALYFDEGATPIFDLGTINGGTTGGATYIGNF